MCDPETSEQPAPLSESWWARYNALRAEPWETLTADEKLFLADAEVARANAALARRRTTEEREAGRLVSTFSRSIGNLPWMLLAVLGVLALSIATLLIRAPVIR